ncbi:hypothetical protein D3C87_1370090 [compost metagenome]
MPVAELEVKVTEPPAQKVVGAAPALTVGVGGNGFIVIVFTEEIVEQPAAEETITLILTLFKTKGALFSVNVAVLKPEIPLVASKSIQFPELSYCHL